MSEPSESKFIELGIEDLFLFPITLPAKGLFFLLEKIAEMADQEQFGRG